MFSGSLWVGWTLGEACFRLSIVLSTRGHRGFLLGAVYPVWLQMHPRWPSDQAKWCFTSMIRQVCPWGPWRLVVQLALLFAFLLLTVERLRLTDRAPSIMHRCSVIGASFDVNLAKFNAIVSDSNYTQPFHQGHFRIILFFMCILKYGSKFWATLPELELIISFQQWTNALCLGSKAVIFFFFFEVGNFKWGFYSMKLLTGEQNLEVNHLFFVGILKCHRGYLAERPLLCFIWPIFIHSNPPPNLYFYSWHDSRSCLQLLFGEGLKSGFIGYCIPWETCDSYFVPGLLSDLLFLLEASPTPHCRWSLDSRLNFYLLLSVSPFLRWGAWCLLPCLL